MKKKRLGEILVEAKLITQAQLKEALEDQKALGGRIGNIIFEKCLIKEKDYLRALSSYLGIAAIDFTKVTLPEKVIKLIPKEVAWEHMVLPVRLLETPAGKVLILAMADPLDLAALDKISQFVHVKIEPALALESTLRFILMDYYTTLYGQGDYRLTAQVTVGRCDEIVQSAPPFATQLGPDASTPTFFIGEPETEKEAPGFFDAAKSAHTEQLLEKFEAVLSREPAKASQLLIALLKLSFKKELISPEEFMDTLRNLALKSPRRK